VQSSITGNIDTYFHGEYNRTRRKIKLTETGCNQPKHEDAFSQVILTCQEHKVTCSWKNSINGSL
jgi:hypothetical protein